MKNIHLLAVLLVVPFLTNAQFNLNTITKDVQNAASGKKKLSNQEVIDGLKEALNVGTNNSTASASKVDGYLKNPKITIPFPKEAQQMEKTLRDLGMNKQVDDFITSMNRAAEEAAKDAAPIFINAIKNMTITDGMSILKGADTAATGYLRKQTSADLTAKFLPVIKAALDKVEVTKYWQPLVTRYNQVPFVTKQNPKLDEYVNAKALSGLFYLVSQEELKIRKAPAARVTDLLKKVFGSK